MAQTVLEPGRKIRVLVVDDSAVIRKLVTEALSGDPDIEVVGSAPNGNLALQKTPQLNPDVVTLDIEMPEMDGLATLKALRKLYPKLLVIMCSTLTQRGAGITIEALAAGAADYVTKGSNAGSTGQPVQALRAELTPKIKQFFRRSGTAPEKILAPAPLSAVAARTGQRVLNVIGIGVSTGGPSALADLLPQFPEDLEVPIAIVQHMPPMFTRLLAERLDQICKIRICEAQQDMPLEPGKAVIAPGDYHLALRRKEGSVVCALHQGPAENSCRPAVDVLFRSLCEIYGGATLGVILTGMGQDGLRGGEVIKAAGGELVAQDEASSVVWGMPGAVVRAGLADAVAPLPAVASEVMRRVRPTRFAFRRT